MAISITNIIVILKVFELIVCFLEDVCFPKGFRQSWWGFFRCSHTNDRTIGSHRAKKRGLIIIHHHPSSSIIIHHHHHSHEYHHIRLIFAKNVIFVSTYAWPRRTHFCRRTSLLSFIYFPPLLRGSKFLEGEDLRRSLPRDKMKKKKNVLI